jgi:hypothetical protein
MIDIAIIAEIKYPIVPTPYHLLPGIIEHTQLYSTNRPLDQIMSGIYGSVLCRPRLQGSIT